MAPATKSGIQKLYVVKDGNDICYVGITSQPMSSRHKVHTMDSLSSSPLDQVVNAANNDELLSGKVGGGVNKTKPLRSL